MPKFYKMTCVLCVLLTALPDCTVQGKQPESSTWNTNSLATNASSDPYSYRLSSCSGNGTDFCSVWGYCDGGSCKCGMAPPQILQCNVLSNSSLSAYNCITFNEKEGLFEGGVCIYATTTETYLELTMPSITLPRETVELNDFMCGKMLNRSGTLCGECKDGHSPLVYSFELNCVPCPNGRENWWKYVLSAFLPLTLFCFIIFFFNVNVISSHFYGFVFYSQIVFEPTMVRLVLSDVKTVQEVQTPYRYLAAFYGVWNLDFFRAFDLGICLGTDTLQTLSLDLIVGVFPFLLMFLTYILVHLHNRNFRLFVIIWKPFRMVFSFFKRHWEVKTSLIDAFATFFFLSNIKFLSSSTCLLVPVKIFQLNATGHLDYSWRLFYDASVVYLGQRHLPYAILCAAMLLTFVILPGLLLTVYPFRCFQRLLNLFPVRWYILHTFMDSFQGCFKNGTEPGTRDCRWFSSIFLITRCLLMIVMVLTSSTTYFSLAAMVLVLVAILFVIVQPYKDSERNFTYTNATFLLLIALWYLGVLGVVSADKQQQQMISPLDFFAGMAVVFPLLYVSANTLHWMYNKRRFGVEMIRRLQAWRHGYKTL